MTYEEALEHMAKERDCAPHELTVCDHPSCDASECLEHRALMKQPGPMMLQMDLPLVGSRPGAKKVGMMSELVMPYFGDPPPPNVEIAAGPFNELTRQNDFTPEQQKRLGCFADGDLHLAREPSRLVLPTDAKARGEYPMWDGLFGYFQSALCEVARLSHIANEQHNPGEPLHWARGKSMDHKNKILKHLLDAEHMDTDSTLHATKLAWRALALLQEILEKRGAARAPNAY